MEHLPSNIPCWMLKITIKMSDHHRFHWNLIDFIGNGWMLSDFFGQNFFWTTNNSNRSKGQKYNTSIVFIEKNAYAGLLPSFSPIFFVCNFIFLSLCPEVNIHLLFFFPFSMPFSFHAHSIQFSSTKLCKCKVYALNAHEFSDWWQGVVKYVCCVLTCFFRLLFSL